MLPNCEHEDCGEYLELAEVCSGIRFNSMVMLAQVARRTCLSKSRYRSGYDYLHKSLSRFETRPKSVCRYGVLSSYDSRSRARFYKYETEWMV